MNPHRFPLRTLALGVCVMAGLYLGLPYFQATEQPNPPLAETGGAKTPPADEVSKADPGLPPLDCVGCAQAAQNALQDPSKNLPERLALARALIQQGTYSGTLAVVRAIWHSAIAGDSEAEDGLLQALAEARTQDSAAALAAIVAGEVEVGRFRDLPEELQAAIRKAIRLIPEAEATGRLLAEQYRRAGPEAAHDLEAIGHPFMVATLAQQAQANGDGEGLGRFTRQLANLDDPKTLDGISSLGETGTLPLEQASAMAYGWVNAHRGQAEPDRYAASLSDAETSPATRSVAAMALAASASPNTLAALQKAYGNETDPAVRASLRTAIAQAVPAAAGR